MTYALFGTEEGLGEWSMSELMFSVKVKSHNTIKPTSAPPEQTLEVSGSLQLSPFLVEEPE